MHIDALATQESRSPADMLLIGHIGMFFLKGRHWKARLLQNNQVCKMRILFTHCRGKWCLLGKKLTWMKRPPRDSPNKWPTIRKVLPFHGIFRYTWVYRYSDSQRILLTVCCVLLCFAVIIHRFYCQRLIDQHCDRTWISHHIRIKQWV